MHRHSVLVQIYFVFDNHESNCVIHIRLKKKIQIAAFVLWQQLRYYHKATEAKAEPLSLNITLTPWTALTVNFFFRRLQHDLLTSSQLCTLCSILIHFFHTVTISLSAHLLQVQDFVLHFLHRPQQFGLAQSGLLQLRLQAAHKLLCVLKTDNSCF